jgi:hypothetical protein
MKGCSSLNVQRLNENDLDKNSELVTQGDKAQGTRHKKQVTSNKQPEKEKGQPEMATLPSLLNLEL